MNARTASRQRRLSVRLSAAALVWSLGLVLAALVAPAYSTSSGSSGVDGVTLGSATLVQENGAWVLILVGIPALASAIVMLALHARRAGARWGAPLAWTALAVLTAEAVVGLMTIGLFIVPAIALLALAVTRSAPGA
ncbi:MAG TPA: hypothetical protein VHV28_05875 [Solirubrobacteraceae bacterium]|jgi:hypothetical protein|nr:hypothetical protein [Solirubrobacteraceae bacterium]